MLDDHTPAITGTGSTGAGDDGSVNVKVYAGTTASGSPVQTLTPALAAGAFSATPASLPDGTYTVVASQGDQAGNTGTSAARTFRIDTTAPAVTITSPANGSSTTDTAPALSGAAGNVDRRRPQVTVKVYSGGSASGTPVRTLTVTRSGGAWSATVSPALAPGTYTAQAEQSDDAGHTGRSSAVTFTIVAPEPGEHRTVVLRREHGRAVRHGDRGAALVHRRGRQRAHPLGRRRRRRTARSARSAAAR